VGLPLACLVLCRQALASCHVLRMARVGGGTFDERQGVVIGVRGHARLLWLVSQAPAFGAATPIPPYAGATESISYKVTVDGQPVFVYRHPTYNQFQWMDLARFSMPGKVRVTIETLVRQQDVVTCNVRPLAYGIKPETRRSRCSASRPYPSCTHRAEDAACRLPAWRRRRRSVSTVFPVLSTM
jgi:hypothetical protein